MGTRGCWGFRDNGSDRLTYVQYDSNPSGLGAKVLSLIQQVESIDALAERSEYLITVQTDMDDDERRVPKNLLPEVMYYLHNVFNYEARKSNKPLLWYEATIPVRYDPMLLLKTLPDVAHPSGLTTTPCNNDPVSRLFDCFGGIQCSPAHNVSGWQPENKQWMYWYDASGFIRDGVMCENAYVIDFDKNCLEYYVGDFKERYQKYNRYAMEILFSNADTEEVANKLVITANQVCKLVFQMDLDEVRKRHVSEIVQIMESVQELFHHETTTGTPELDNKGDLLSGIIGG